MSSANQISTPVRETGEHKIFAALDLGTNNCRLMIARPDNNRLKVIDSFSQIVRLGEGMSSSGVLSENAMTRTITALRQCADKLKNHQITEGHFIATEACRRASNGKDFLARVKDETGLNLTIIPEKDEAVLAFLGCAPLLDSETDYAMMVDVGGGSTELMLVDMRDILNPQTVRIQSLPIGVMTVAEEYGTHEMNTDGYRDMVLELAAMFADFADSCRWMELKRDNYMQMICCSGTVTTLGALYKNLPRYDRREVDGLKIPRTGLQNIIEKAIAMSPGERAENPCIGRDRADFLLAGCGILDAACRMMPLPAITVADRGVREGILLSLFQKHII